MKDAAIQEAFYEGASEGIKDIVEELHEHPAITSEKYADGLIKSWNNDKLTVFQFLLAQADQGDLKEVKKALAYIRKIKNSVKPLMRLDECSFDRLHIKCLDMIASSDRVKRHRGLLKETFDGTKRVMDHWLKKQGPGENHYGLHLIRTGTDGNSRSRMMD